MDGSLAVKKLPVAHLRVRRSISGEECPPVCVEHLCNEAYSPVSLDTTQRTKKLVSNGQYTYHVSHIVIINLVTCYN